MFNRSLVIGAAQVEREPLERLEAMFGGKIHRACLPKGNRQRAWQWAVWGIQAAGLMFTLYSFMSPRRKQQITTAVKKWRATRAHKKYWVTDEMRMLILASSGTNAAVAKLVGCSHMMVSRLRQKALGPRRLDRRRKENRTMFVEVDQQVNILPMAADHEAAERMAAVEQ